MNIVREERDGRQGGGKNYPADNAGLDYGAN